MENSLDHTSTIFVPIAACNEYLIELTIKSALSMSSNPERIFFGVFNNILQKEKSLWDNPFFTDNPQIFYTEILTPAPMGTGFGRMNASLLANQDYDYVLQIDSHTVFTKDWDLKLIENFNKVKEIAQTDKIILSAVPRGNMYYNVENRDVLLSHEEMFTDWGSSEIDPYTNNYHEMIDYKLSKPEIRYDGIQGNHFVQQNVDVPITYGAESFGEEEYPEINCIHASIVFFQYRVIREVLHDPADTFNGDQINQGLRLLSRGYRIFSMKDPLLLSLGKTLPHLELNSSSPILFDPEWNWRVSDGYKDCGWKYLEYSCEKSKTNYEKIFSGEYAGYWGAPDEKSLSEAKKIMGFKEIKNNE
jgi:hypothetical protein